MHRLAAAVILATLVPAACGPAEHPRPGAEPASNPEETAARRATSRLWAFEQGRLNPVFERRLARDLRIGKDDFPYPDLCRTSDGNAGPVAAGALSGRSALAASTGPARDLHDAVRKGAAAEVRRWLARAGSVDTPIRSV